MFQTILKNKIHNKYYNNNQKKYMNILINYHNNKKNYLNKIFKTMNNNFNHQFRCNNKFFIILQIKT